MIASVIEEQRQYPNPEGCKSVHLCATSASVKSVFSYNKKLTPSFIINCNFSLAYFSCLIFEALMIYKIFVRTMTLKLHRSVKKIISTSK